MSNLFKMKKIIKYIGIIASLLFLVYGISLFFIKKTANYV